MMHSLLLICLTLSQSPDAALVIEAGTAINVRSITTGTNDPVLQLYAQQHADRQARQCRQGHQQWDRRYRELAIRLPLHADFTEIAAESWPWQTREQSAPEMFTCWRHSPGHWRVANGSCAIYGYAMARGRNGIWYGCGITAQRRHR